MFYGYKCKDCKYLCHRDCANKAPPSCGLPSEFVDIFTRAMNNNEDGGNSWTNRQNSLNTNEWEIPYHELEILEEIGTGTFCSDKVYKGYWHGDVAIKCLDVSDNHLEDSKVLDTFTQEVSTFRRTRHDNLVLFMGACMKPPHLAIVTSFCKGDTLYKHIHVNKNIFITTNEQHNRPNLEMIVPIAQQICLGMAYLHSKGIVHKDLKTRNIFYDHGKVCITDFGFFSLKKLCPPERKGWLAIPKGWLCYLAPELMRKLTAHHEPECNDLPFTSATDVYSFGTIWYELILGDLPYRNLSPEITIWQVGNYIKQPLINLHAPKELKDILVYCWSHKYDFTRIHDLLESLPRKGKGIQRSSSM